MHNLALVCFNKSFKTLVSSPTFETSIGETPYGHLLVGIPYVGANSPYFLIEFNLLETSAKITHLK